ncbi:uncharacterized protein LOC122502840 [Leptopilina heterotoma]|uniref:uncharacterized protein LOC122502840 n=1 Tax=Leptopilina heterotoma TaxID=63436 RepID=UPI001CAA093C|nr:uncharacterized protein LOC122502840 [Leptopilina heterotoma]
MKNFGIFFLSALFFGSVIADEMFDDDEWFYNHQNTAMEWGKLREKEGKKREYFGKLREEEGKLREAEGKLREEEGNFREKIGRLREERGRLRQQERMGRSVELEKLNTNIINNNQNNVIQDKEEILKIAQQIENGNPPANVDSNTISFTTNIRGKPYIIKSTYFSTSVNTEGTIYSVKTTYDEEKLKDVSISVLTWNENGSSTKYYNNIGPGIIINGKLM